MLTRACAASLAILLVMPVVPISTPAAASAPTARQASQPTTAAPLAVFTPTTPVLAAPGVTLANGTWATTDGPQTVHVVDVDPTATTTQFETSRPASGVRTLQTLGGQVARATAEGHRVVAAVNGDTWLEDPVTHLTAPTGVQIHGGEVLTAAPGTRSAFGVDAAGIPQIAPLSVAVALSIGGGPPITIDRVNKPRRSGLLQLFTRQWGSRTGTAGSGTEVVLEGSGLRLGPSGTWMPTVVAISSTGADTTIPTGGWVLSASGTATTLIEGLQVGEQISITTTVAPNWTGVRDAVSGRDWLVRDGALAGPATAPDAAAPHPRTAVGIRADGHVLLLTVDGRLPATSAGVTDADLAELLLSVGAVQAINLDGGGSTTLYEREPGDIAATIANVPSDGHERVVASGLLVVSTVPTGPLNALVVRPGLDTAIVGQTIAFQAAGVDAAVNGVPIAAPSVQWSAAGDAGAVGADGLFRALAPGAVTLSASVDGVTTSDPLTVVADTYPPVPATPNISLRTGGAATANVVPLSLSWSATDVGTGVARYALQRRDGAGPWVDVPLPSALTRSVAVVAPIGGAVSFRVQATDRAGNASAWRTSPTVGPRVTRETGSGVHYAGRWIARTGSGYLDGMGRASSADGATVTYTFTGRSVAWIAPKGPKEGSAAVWIDGTRVAALSLNAAAVQPGRLVYARAWTTSGRHTLKIRVSGTAGHPWVSVDEFAVLDNASAYPTLIGAGDIASCTTSGDTATAALLDQQPGTVMAVGDLAYQSGSAAEFRNCYGPTWGRLLARTRPVPGNHEYATSGAAPYFAYFGSRAGTAGQGWYAYDLGDWRVYALNSNCASVGGCDIGSPQETWLRADLAANPRACVAAYWHHPEFSSGVHGSSTLTSALWQNLYAAGADVVVNGHDHDYERFAPQAPDGNPDPVNGIREFVVGTGGVGLRAFATVQANSEVRRSGLHGVLRLSLLPNGYTWRFIAAGSTWTDTGTAACH